MLSVILILMFVSIGASALFVWSICRAAAMRWEK